MDYADFDQNRYKLGLAALLGIELKMIELEIKLGSLVVDAMVTTTSSESSTRHMGTMELITPAMLSASTGAAVASLAPARVSGNDEFVTGASGLSGVSDSDTSPTMTIMSVCAVVGTICITISICMISRRIRRRARRDDKVSRAAQPATKMSDDSLSTLGIELGVSATAPSLSPHISEPPHSLPTPAAPRTFEGNLYKLETGSVGIVLGDTPQGVVINTVVPGAQASKAGVPVGGIITAVNGEAASQNKASLNRQLASAARPIRLHVKLPMEIDPIALPSPINTPAAHSMRFSNLPLKSERPMHSTLEAKSAPGKEDRFSRSGRMPSLPSSITEGATDDSFEADDSSNSAASSTRAHVPNAPIPKPAGQVNALAALLSARGPSGGQSSPSGPSSGQLSARGQWGEKMGTHDLPCGQLSARGKGPTTTAAVHANPDSARAAGISVDSPPESPQVDREKCSPLPPEPVAFDTSDSHSDAPPESPRFGTYEEERLQAPTAVGLVALHRAAEENEALAEALDEMKEEKKNLAVLRAEERLMQREDAMQRRNAEREAARQLRLELEAAEVEADAAAEAAAAAGLDTAAAAAAAVGTAASATEAAGAAARSPSCQPPRPGSVRVGHAAA